MQGEVPSSTNAEWTEKQLPPVKPPTAGFLMQLFFVPMVIVAAIVSVWLLFGWLADAGSKPDELAAELERLNKGSWQKAVRLSNMLRDPRNAELRTNRALAERLAATLDGQLDDLASASSERQLLKIWLCMALGQFDIDVGLPTLIRAASSSQNVEIRKSAIQGIGLLAERLKTNIAISHPEVLTELRDAASTRSDVPDEELEYRLLRVRTAYTLGIIGGPEALDTLAAMTSDYYPDARYNAATGLARHGDERAVPGLSEMLELDNEEAIRYEAKPETSKDWKQQLVIINGLRAIQQLYTRSSAAPDETVLSKLAALKESGKLKSEAAIELGETLRLLEKR